MIFPGFPGVLSFFQVFQVEWEPCNESLAKIQSSWDTTGEVKSNLARKKFYKEVQKRS